MDRFFVVVNCDNLVPGQTLGVAHFAFGLLSAMRTVGQVRVLCKVTEDMYDAYQHPGPINAVHDAVAVGRAGTKLDQRSWPIQPEPGEAIIEYSPHQFQVCISDAPSIRTCHDLHVFDIPWKYKNQREVAKTFRNNMSNASRILTEFPRTAASLSSYVASIKSPVVLTESPLMLDATRPDDEVVFTTAQRFGIDGSESIILYPAQLQQHKNHRNLFSGLAEARLRGKQVRLVCPGSEFKSYHTSLLRMHIADLGLKGFVELPGFVSEEELRALYALCDGVICPSLAEGGAYVALEGLAFRRPVACASIESARMHLESVGAVVALFDPYDVGQISEAIIHLVDAGHSMIGPNEGARRLVRSWSFNDVAVRYLEAMKDAVAS